MRGIPQVHLIMRQMHSAEWRGGHHEMHAIGRTAGKLGTGTHAVCRPLTTVSQRSDLKK